MAKEEKSVIIASGAEGASYWSLGNYGRSTWKHKWWVLGSTVLVGLAGFLVMKLAINPSRSVATSKYSYNLATEVDEKDNTVHYLDGEVFNYAEAISAENLLKVKESSADYSSIDVEKMVKNNDISVKENEKSEKNPNEETTYTLTVKSKYFANNTQMASFVKDVVSTLQEKSNAAISSYTVDKTISAKFSSLEFDQQIAALTNQYKNIELAYNELSEKFTSSAKLEEGSLSEAITDFKESYKEGSDTVFAKLSNQIYQYGLAMIGEDQTIADKVDSLKAQAENYKTTLKSNVQMRKVYSTELSSLSSAATIINNSSTDFTKELVELSKNIAAIDANNTELISSLRIYGYTDGNVDVTTLTVSAIDAFEYNTGEAYCKSGIIYKLANAADPAEKKADCIAFGAILSDYAKQLVEDDLVTVNNNHHYLYNTYNNKVNFYNSGIVEESGSISSILIAGIAAVVGFAASSLVVTAIEISKAKEKEATKASK